MTRESYDNWLSATVELFEETEDGARALEWLDVEDLREAFDDGMTPIQVYDKYTKGWFF